MDDSTEALLEFYILDPDYMEKDLPLKESAIYKDLDRDFKSMKANFEEETRLENFGRAADWPALVVEWLAKSDTANALSNLGGLVGLAALVVPVWKKLKPKQPFLKVGLPTAKAIAIDAVKNEIGENIDGIFKVISAHETQRFREGFGFKDFFLLIETHFNETRVYFLHIDWDGNIKAFLSF